MATKSSAKRLSRLENFACEDMGAYLVGEAGITPACKVTPAVAVSVVATPSPTSADATVASENSETVPRAEFATKFAAATATLFGSAGFGLP
jgi:histidine ammonia-lyase